MNAPFRPGNRCLHQSTFDATERESGLFPTRHPVGSGGGEPARRSKSPLGFLWYCGLHTSFERLGTDPLEIPSCLMRNRTRAAHFGVERT